MTGYHCLESKCHPNLVRPKTRTKQQNHKFISSTNLTLLTSTYTNLSLLQSRTYPKTYHLPFSGPRSSWPGDFPPPLLLPLSTLACLAAQRPYMLNVFGFALTMWYNGRSVSFHFRFADWWHFARNVVHLKKKKLLVWPWGLIFCLCFCLFVCVVFLSLLFDFCFWPN